MTTTDYAKTHEPKREQLRQLLWDLCWHTHNELREVGGVRYSARLLELKRLGYHIKSQSIKGDNGKRYRLTSRTVCSPKEKKVKVYLTEDQAQSLCDGFLSPSVQGVIGDALKSFRTNKEKL
jgi:hypothetical protein